jgi:hypothetical protein
MKSRKLKDHSEGIHKDFVGKDIEFKNRGANVEILSFGFNWSVYADE